MVGWLHRPVVRGSETNYQSELRRHNVKEFHYHTRAMDVVVMEQYCAHVRVLSALIYIISAPTSIPIYALLLYREEGANLLGSFAGGG